MELAALALLGSAGYILARQTTPVARPTIRQKEGYTNQTQRNVANLRSSLRGPNPQLDIMYNDLMGQGALNSQPNVLAGDLSYLPGNLISKTSPVDSKVLNLSLDQMASPADSITSATPDVMMNPAGIEENPTYVDGDDLVSALSGKRMKSAEFVHNNMQPYFGSRVRQNVDAGANSSYLDAYNGSGSLQIRKKEVEQMFDNTQQGFGNVYGLESSSDFVQSRINDPRNRAGEKPFEPVRVAPGVGEGFSSTGKGGFQQIEVNDLMIKNMKRTDDLRVATNPKLSYNIPVVPGQQFIGKSADNAGEVRKYRPDSFYIDENGERFGAAGQGAFQKEAVRSIQVMPETARAETSVEYKGAGASQDFGMNYVVGSYRKPMVSQYSGAGYRNADGTMLNLKAEHDDFGKESFEIRPNERFFTSERGQGLNLSPAEAGAVTTHFEDESRPTRRGETIGNAQQAGNATGYAGGAPAITVWDPNDIARTTVKEGTIFLDRFGIAAPADGPTRLKAYDPADIARPTQKAQISAKSAYTGGPKAAHERHMNHTFAYNMRLNPNKQQVAKGRSLAGGNIQMFKGDEPNVTSRKLDTDMINDRAPAINRSLDLGPGSADIGTMRGRAPPAAKPRITREIIEAVDSNPLMQSLRRNAEKDDQRLGSQLKIAQYQAFE